MTTTRQELQQWLRDHPYAEDDGLADQLADEEERIAREGREALEALRAAGMGK